MKLMLLTLLLSVTLLAQTPQPLYPDGVPGAVGNLDVDQPAITFYKAPQPNGTAVLVCPGGGYQHLAMDHEGKQIAEWFNSLGITAAVLKYRLGPRYHHPAMLDDARAGIRALRARAAELGINPARVGVIGFSAGGHLASTLSTHYQTPQERPDFSILVYPVISLATKYAHAGSRTNLLGDNPDPALVESLSNENEVTPYTPPTFLFHTDDDTVVPVMNSIRYFQALKAAGVRAEMHVYARGRHGVGLAPSDPVLSTWPARLKDWLTVEGFLPPPLRQ